VKDTAKPWLGRSRCTQTRRIECNKLRATRYVRLASVAHPICSFVHAQQNCENPIRAIFFMPQGRQKNAGKSGRRGAAGLDRIGCARHGKLRQCRELEELRNRDT
jgi:hypothetical protein